MFEVGRYLYVEGFRVLGPIERQAAITDHIHMCIYIYMYIYIWIHTHARASLIF